MSSRPAARSFAAENRPHPSAAGATRLRCALPERLDEPARTAVSLLLEEGDELAEPERRVLCTLGAMLADPLVGRWADRDPQKEEGEALSHLVDHYRSRQLEAIGELE